MKICWDNLENIKLTENGNFRDTFRKITYYLKVCTTCNEEFLGRIKSEYCSYYCSRKGKKLSEETKRRIGETNKGKKLSEEHKKKIGEAGKGRKHTEETKRRMSEAGKGRKHTEETKRRMSEAGKGKRKGIKLSEETKRKMRDAQKGKNSYNWKGGVKKLDIPFYDTYAPQIDWCEEVRRNKENRNILEVKCSYCGKWYIPTSRSVIHRIQVLKGNYQGECKLYCSDHCKKCCPVYNKTAETLMREDDVRSGRDPWWKMVREVQPQLRQLVFERDGYKCIKCGSKEYLHCHHIEGILWEPLTSADIDMCITVCNNCHMVIHKIDGCGYNDMKCK